MTMPITDKEQIKHILSICDEAETREALKELGYDWAR